MAEYYVDVRPNKTGFYVLHKQDACPSPPGSAHRQHIGQFDWCMKAKREAEARGFAPADGCWICTPECHRHGEFKS